MRKFAKLFERGDEQIFVKIDAAENHTSECEIRFYFQPEGLGVCSYAVSFDAKNGDTEEAWGRADKMFADLTKDRVFASVAKVKADIIEPIDINDEQQP